MSVREALGVEVTRGGIVESRHRVHAVVVDAGGAVVEAFGDAQIRVFPRSAVKPLQALPLIESGAADRWGLDARHLAIATASHAGEPVHVTLVREWLGRIGLGDHDLGCGAHLPGNPDVLIEHARSGTALSQAHSNCSGKHTGMLSHALHLGDDPRGYVEPDHPVQHRVTAVLQEMCDTDFAAAPRGVDGCSIPTYAVPLRSIALGAARLVDPSGQGSIRAAACRRIVEAMTREPYLVAGRARCCTAVITATAGRAVVKVGAEGVYLGGLTARGLGLALKVEDGTTRAAEAVLLWLLARHGALEGVDATAIAPWAAPTVTSVRGAPVGEIRVVGP